ncbi:MAG TPA: NADH-quinone oxidoreductase subunit N [Thermodesulfobacteriota bacterium]|nr:NADH-quinone oxidoreductase subunit N [Thermodesulfobacteriota bacterium]
MQLAWIDLLPQILLAGGGFLIFCLGGFWKKRPQGLLFGVALAVAIGSGAAALLLEPREPRFLSMFETGGYGRFFTLLISLIITLSLLFSYQYAKSREMGGDEFYGLLLLSGLGMTLAAGATHWLILFLGLETLSLALYILIAIRKRQPASNEAGLKYFIMGAVSSSFFTFGIAIVYAMTGKMDILQSLSPGTQTVSTPGLLVGLSLILIGIGFKVSMVPFHLWTPDVYQGAPSPVTAFLAAGSKVALFAALLRMVYYVSGNPSWTYYGVVLWILAFLTMTVGNITALVQSRVKRLLAYSSIAQMGYLLMTLLAVRKGGVAAIMFYLTVYALMDLGAFGTLATLSGEEEDLDVLDHFKGLAYLRPWRSALLTVCLISLAGLPPMAGFIGKFILFRAVLEARFVVLAVLGMVTVIVSIYFYFKVIVTLFMQPMGRKPVTPDLDIFARIAGFIVLLLILGLGLLPSPLLSILVRILPLTLQPG